MGTLQLSEKQYIILLNGFNLSTLTRKTKEWHFCDSEIVKFCRWEIPNIFLQLILDELVNAVAECDECITIFPVYWAWLFQDTCMKSYIWEYIS